MKTIVRKKDIFEVCNLVENSIHHLNRGGCGVFAFLMGSALSQFDNVKEVRIKVYSWMLGPKTNINDCVPKYTHDINSWNSKGVDFAHILIQVKFKGGERLIFDSEGKVNKRQRESLMRGSLRLADIEPIVQKSSGWNDTFDRDQIPELKQIIENNLVLKESLPLNESEWDLY